MDEESERAGGRTPFPEDEDQRLEELRSYGVLDTLPEQAYDDITYLAARICDCPIALMTLIDEDRQWFKAKIGLEDTETSREVAFCAHAILEPTKLLVVPDASRDERFAGNPLVTSEPSIRFYAGAPLHTSSGRALGTLCVIDRRPRELGREDRLALAALSRQAMAQLELRRAVAELESRAEDRLHYQRILEDQQRELERANLELAEQNLTDSLTGLHNRRALYARLDEECSRARRHCLPLTIALVGVDRFEAYLEDFGHPAGERALQQIAELIRHGRRRTDFVARHGAKEFAIVFGNTTAGGAGSSAEKMRLRVATARWDHRPLTVSVGLAPFGDPLTTRAALLSAADRALYTAKAAGRNRVETFAPSAD